MVLQYCMPSWDWTKGNGNKVLSPYALRNNVISKAHRISLLSQRTSLFPRLPASRGESFKAFCAFSPLLFTGMYSRLEGELLWISYPLQERTLSINFNFEPSKLWLNDSMVLRKVSQPYLKKFKPCPSSLFQMCIILTSESCVLFLVLIFLVSVLPWDVMPFPSRLKTLLVQHSLFPCGYLLVVVNLPF